MRGRSLVALQVVLVTVCGVATAYASWQPEFEKQKQERTGGFQAQHPENNEKALSKAIFSDLDEAKTEAKSLVSRADKGGFAWGIRQALFGPKQSPATNGHTSATPQELDKKKG